jgi:histidine kinase
MDTRPKERQANKSYLPLYRSLSFKLGLSIGLINLVAILTFAYFTINAQSRKQMNHLVQDVRLISETLANSIRHSMGQYGVSGIESVVKSVGLQNGISLIRIVNHSGKIRISTKTNETGQRVSETDPVCRACHLGNTPPQKVLLSERTLTYRYADEKNTLGMLTPIYNEKTCFSADCHIHSENEGVLGVLEVGLSLEDTDRAISDAIRKTSVFALLIFVGLVTLLSVALISFVWKPVHNIMEAVGHMSRGDYGKKLRVSSRDELGELAKSFNIMGERIQAREGELERSRREYQTLFENVPTYIAVVDRDYKIVQANRNFKETFGEVVGVQCFRAYKGLDEKCEDCPVERTFSTGKPQVSEEHGLSREGKEVYYLVYTAPVLDSHGEVRYAIEMSIDLTERKHLEKELRASREFLNNLIDNSIHGIVAVDARGRVIVFNSAAESILGYRAAEVMGTMELERLLPREFTRRIQRELEQDSAEEPVREVAHETWLRSKTGEAIPVSFAGVILREAMSTIGAVGFFQDLRQVKMLEREKLQAQRLAVVGQTVAALAHGIKNIITGLEGGVYVIQTAMNRGDEALLQKGWGMVERNIEKIAHLVKDLLSYSKVAVSEVQPTKPNHVAEEVFRLFEEKAGQAGIKLRMELDPKMLEAQLDPKAVHSCLTNLMSNAIDACTDDEEKEDHWVAIRTRLGVERSVMFEVEDNGIGMDRETVERLFSNFFTTKGTKGTGLGLMVTHKLVHEHGGQITVRSKPGKGSLFCIKIPQEQYQGP